MYNFKDKGQIPLKHQKIYAIAIAGSYGLSVIHYLEYGYLSLENIAGMALATFLIYGIWFGGMYKIIRWYAERKAKQRDNNWSPNWKK